MTARCDQSGANLGIRSPSNGKSKSQQIPLRRLDSALTSDSREMPNMNLSRVSRVVALLSVACLSCMVHAASETDRLALQNTGIAIRAAFAKGDVAEAMRYHHPDVGKALSYPKVLIGRDGVAAATPCEPVSPGVCRKSGREFVDRKGHRPRADSFHDKGHSHSRRRTLSFQGPYDGRVGSLYT